jgi:hypothetical protein
MATDALLYAEVGWAATLLVAARRVGFLAVIALRLSLRRGAAPVTGFRWLLGLVFLTGALLRVGAVLAAPDPVIDVYVWLRDAPGALLRGENPYTVEYFNVYQTERAQQYGMTTYGPTRWVLPAYPPLPMLFALPFRAVGLDVRYANVLCDLVAAWVLYRAGSRAGKPAVGALAAAAYLHFPQAPFMIEQAWYEPMLAACLGGGLLLAARGRFAGHLLLGIGLTGKQYGVALVWPWLKALWPHRKAFLIGIAVATALILGPFFLWNPRAFLDVVFYLHIEHGVQEDGLTLHTLAADLWGVAVPSAALWAVAAVVIAWVTWQTPRGGVRSAFWTGTALLVFCLCHNQGYFNYFYLCCYLFLLGVVGMVTEAGGDGEFG